MSSQTGFKQTLWFAKLIWKNKQSETVKVLSKLSAVNIH